VNPKIADLGFSLASRCAIRNLGILILREQRRRFGIGYESLPLLLAWAVKVREWICDSGRYGITESRAARYHEGNVLERRFRSLFVQKGWQDTTVTRCQELQAFREMSVLVEVPIGAI